MKYGWKTDFLKCNWTDIRRKTSPVWIGPYLCRFMKPGQSCGESAGVLRAARQHLPAAGQEDGEGAAGLDLLHVDSIQRLYSLSQKKKRETINLGLLFPKETYEYWLRR